jgi:hypothetical protein
MTLVNRASVVALAGLVLQLSAAHAQNAGAEALFREGRTLIKQGKLKEGCDKLEASEKLESSVGTLLNLGDCREKLGKVASAWAAFRKAEAQAKRAGNDRKREQEARRRAVKLEPQLAHVTVQVGPKSQSEGLIIRRDDEIVDPALLGDAIPVDPGAHVIVAEAPGYKPWRQEVSIGKGGRRFVVVPTLEKLPEPPKPAPPPVVETAPATPSVVIDQPARPAKTIVVRDTWSTTRQVAIGVGVVGAAALGGGLYFGNRANDLESQSNDICPTSTCDDPEGLRLNDDAQDNALRANVLLIAGGAALATATVMWFVGGPDERTVVVSPAISDTTVGASVTRRF